MKVRDAIAKRVAELEALHAETRSNADASLAHISAQIAAAKALTGPFEGWLDLDTTDPETRFDIVAKDFLP